MSTHNTHTDDPEWTVKEAVSRLLSIARDPHASGESRIAAHKELAVLYGVEWQGIALREDGRECPGDAAECTKAPGRKDRR